MGCDCDGLLCTMQCQLQHRWLRQCLFLHFLQGLHVTPEIRYFRFLQLVWHIQELHHHLLPLFLLLLLEGLSQQRH